MSSPAAKKAPVFPVGVAGKRELRKALKNASGVEVIKRFQQKNSLHSMMALAFETQPRYKIKTRSKEKEAVESLDTDSVMEFLSHLGVTHYEVHKRISDSLLKQLEDEIRKTTNDDQPLFDLLIESWGYAVSLPELRPIIWAILRQLGEKTPPVVLKALAERDEKEGGLKHEEIYRPLPALLKKLVWEADWSDRIPLEPEGDPAEHLKLVSNTILYETMYPCVQQYCSNKLLVDSANIPFVSSLRDRKVVTTHRRALTSAATSQSVAGAASLMRGANTSNKSDQPTSGKAVAQLRLHLTDSSGSKSVYRPQLLYALLSILIGEHGNRTQTFLGGADYLHCTLVSDILLSAGGPLPKTYHHVHSLARCLDDCVQEGNVTDENIIKIQKLIRHIFQPDADLDETPVKKKEVETAEDSLTNAAKRQLNRIVTEGISAMKETDPQSLFLNPVTDAIAPGYSRIIKKPMCIAMMEAKVAGNEYNNVEDWEQDVKLMYKNCIGRFCFRIFVPFLSLVFFLNNQLI